MRLLSSLLIAGVACIVTACASPPPQRFDHLLASPLFGAPKERVATSEVLATDEAMRHYLNFELASRLRIKGAQAGLIEALYSNSQLKLEYDSAKTKTAAEAFATRSGNCLSLVLMTAAMAHELGLPVAYQSAALEETWSRSGGLMLASGHVNITIGSRSDPNVTRFLSSVTIDFLPAQDLRGMRTSEISEPTVLAMYANNRAVEAIARDELDDAYAWVVEALRLNATGGNAFNTLGVIYLRHGNPGEASAAFEHAAMLEPRNTLVLANLVRGYERLGNTRSAELAQTRLNALEPEPPFYFFDLGMAAMGRGDWVTARRLFSREAVRASYSDEVHFWLSLANWRLGDMAEATQHLRLAVDNSTSRSRGQLYAAKLRWLQAHLQPPERSND